MVTAFQTRGEDTYAATCRKRLRMLATILLTFLAITAVNAPSALAAPEYNESGPAGSAAITLRPFGVNQLALTYHLMNTAGATATEVTLTPVGLNSKPTTQSFGGARADGMVVYPYTPGEKVSVGVHVVF